MDEMPLRRVVALTLGLPPDAALWNAMRVERQAEAKGPKRISLAELGAWFAGTGPGAVLN